MSESDMSGSGGAQLVKELAQTCYMPLMRYALSLAKNENLARDAVQESFLKLLNESKRRKIDYPKAWLFRVCRNKIFDELQRSKRWSEMDESTPETILETSLQPPDRHAEKNDSMERAIKIIQRLNEREREAVRLKFQCGFSYAQISQIMSISENSVGVTLHNALKNLRGMFFEKTEKELKHS